MGTAKIIAQFTWPSEPSHTDPASVILAVGALRLIRSAQDRRLMLSLIHFG